MELEKCLVFFAALLVGIQAGPRERVGNPKCPTPACQKGCRVEERVHGPCRGCVCDRKPPTPKPTLKPTPVPTPPTEGIDEEDKVPCDPPRCKPGCRIATRFEGPCPGCICGQDDEESFQVCGNSCERACWLEKEFDIICPGSGCECGEEEITTEKDIQDPKAACEPPKCGEPGCRIVTPPGGPCPECICDDDRKVFDPRVPCNPPPTCGPGCSLQAVDGQCPECDCPENKEVKDPLKSVQCGPLKCLPGCRIQKVFDGPCPGCECEEAHGRKDPPVQCSDPKCAPGCSVVFEGPCPSCKCNDGEKIPDTGDCELQECPPGCPPEPVPGMPCPQCVCKKDIQQCPREPPCAAPQCRPELDRATGCRVCKCRPQCSPPRCKRFCRMQVGRSGCLECVCPHHWRHRW